MKYLFILLTFLLAKPSSETYDIKLTIHNIKKFEGTVEIGLYDNPDHFMEVEHTFRSISVAVTGDTETVVFRNVPKGIYAISMYHDKNSNGKCDRNFLGIPSEPYAFSNNFTPRFAKPTFNDCKFDLNADASQRIKLIH